MKVVIYTDGSVSKNGHPDAYGGWACILQAYRGCEKVSEVEKFGRLSSNNITPVTNNRAEMYAIYHALECIEKKCDVEIYSDSELVVKTINGEYAKRNNLDLWDMIQHNIDRLKGIGCSISLSWVKGHSSDPLNNRVDKLASNVKKGII